MGLGGDGVLGAWIQEEVGEGGLALCAVHSGNPFFPAGRADRVGMRDQEGLDEVFQFVAQRLVCAEEERFRG